MADKEHPFGLSKYDAEFLKAFHSCLKDLRNLTISNIEYYQRGRSAIHARYYAASCILLEHLQVVEPTVIEIVPRLTEFDFSDEVHANGYRSFISIVNSCCIYLLQLCRHINVNKTSLLFRSSYYLKDLEAFVETLGQLIACLGYLKQLISYSKDGDLFVDDDQSVADELLLEVEMLNTDCFYGHCLGFHFSPSIQKVLQGVLVVMATFSECYEESSQVMQLATSVFNSSKYVLDHELRAKQVVNITRTADIKFCKAFWSIPESPLLSQLRAFTFPHVEVSEVMALEAKNFELPDVVYTDTTVTITPPCAHTGPAPVYVRLISHVVREGMQVTRSRFKPKTGSSSTRKLPRSSGLLFHCHGGGFVAQSSQSHENYLRVWARKLQMPILSVDYSLAPDQPFPRALEECFYAYAWALKHPEQLGWTGENVCFAGDSAGGNLVISTALRAVAYQIRVPDGIMAAYTPFLVQYTPSPARLMSMIDPLLPVGILTRCLAAYAGIADKFSSALAKPTFCNPGKLEAWEIVDSGDTNKDTIGAKLTNHSSCTNCDGQTSNRGADVECLTCSMEDSMTLQEEGAKHSKLETCVHIGEKGDSVKNLMPTSNLCDNNMKLFNTCDSLDDIEDDNEFVICDMEDLDKESQYKGRVAVIDGIEIEQKNKTTIDTDDHDHKHSVDLCGESESMDCEGSHTERIIGSALECSNKEACIIGNDVVVKQTESSLKAKTDICIEESRAKTTAQCTKTIEDAINQIDSKVTIQIEDTCMVDGVEKQHEEDPTEMYAMCQELVDMTVGGPSLGTQTKSLSEMSDMSRVSCHSLDELVDSDWIMEEQGCSTNKMFNTETNFYQSKDSISQMKEGYLKQLSVSDTSDSGIHGDTDVDSCHDNTLLNLVPSELQPGTNSTLSKGIKTSASLNMISTQTFLNEENKTFGTAIAEDQIDSTSKVKFNRRAMSLDLETAVHPSQISAKTPSPHTILRSPNSPQLPHGSRSFEPKRYSVQRKIAQSPIQLFKHLPIVKNMFMSPILAPDDLLLALPDVYLVACHFDPLLDDSITFAKKLSGLDKKVDLHVFDGLPHGFLSFSDASPEAKKASDFCLEKIKAVLQVGE